MTDELQQAQLTIDDFSADATLRPFRLSDYRGKHLVIYFYPKDNTPGCTTESIDFRDHYDEFQKLGTNIVGISRDSMKSHENFSKKLELPFSLVSDPEEAICNRFDVMKTKNRYGKMVRGIERSTFLLDAQGRLVKSWRGVKVAGHIEEILDTLKAMSKD